VATSVGKEQRTFRGGQQRLMKRQQISKSRS